MKVLAPIVLVLIMVIALVYLASVFVDQQTRLESAEANRIRAEAEREEARGRARALIIDAYTSQIAMQTEASIIKMYAAIPLIILGSLGMLGFSIVAVVLFMIVKTLNQPLPQQHIYIVPRGVHRMMLPDQIIYGGENAKIIDGHSSQLQSSAGRYRRG